MDLIQYGKFKSHSGLDLNWKIDCDALSNNDIKAIATIIRKKFIYGKVIGIPRGGLKLAAELLPYERNLLIDPLLIVDDVLTTGKSMEEFREKYVHKNIIGVVIFSRTLNIPNWIHPIFTTSNWT